MTPHEPANPHDLATPHDPSSLRVLSINIRRLRDSRDAVVTVLREARPDVVAVQEVTRGLTGGLRMRRLAAEAGLVHVRTPGARTTGLLVRPGLGVLRSRGIPLRTRPGRTRRGAALVDLGSVRVASVHLGLNRAERLAHVDRLVRVLGAGVAPVVVAGDLNERPGGVTWRALDRHLSDLTSLSGPTYPASGPTQRIDAVLGSSHLRTRSVHVRADEVTRAASDHLPVLVEIGLA